MEWTRNEPFTRDKERRVSLTLSCHNHTEVERERMKVRRLREGQIIDKERME